MTREGIESHGAQPPDDTLGNLARLTIANTGTPQGDTTSERASDPLSDPAVRPEIQEDRHAREARWAQLLDVAVAVVDADAELPAAIKQLGQHRQTYKKILADPQAGRYEQTQRRYIRPAEERIRQAELGQVRTRAVLDGIVEEAALEEATPIAEENVGFVGEAAEQRLGSRAGKHARTALLAAVDRVTQNFTDQFESANDDNDREMYAALLHGCSIIRDKVLGKKAEPLSPEEQTQRTLLRQVQHMHSIQEELNVRRLHYGDATSEPGEGDLFYSLLLQEHQLHTRVMEFFSALPEDRQFQIEQRLISDINEITDTTAATKDLLSFYFRRMAGIKPEVAAFIALAEYIDELNEVTGGAKPPYAIRWATDREDISGGSDIFILLPTGEEKPIDIKNYSEFARQLDSGTLIRPSGYGVNMAARPERTGVLVVQADAYGLSGGLETKKADDEEQPLFRFRNPRRFAQKVIEELEKDRG